MKSSSLRGMLLEFLGKIYPEAVLEIDLIGIFYRDYKDSQIRKALHYLVDKGYVQKIEKQHPFKRYENLVLYKITPAGIDLLEGLIQDSGILVEEKDE